MTSKIKIINKDLDLIHNYNKKKIFYKNKIVLITGYRGFLGFYLSEYLKKFFKTLKLKKLILIDKGFLKKSLNSEITYVNKNINDIDYSNYNPDIIFHLASIASPIVYRKFPIETCNVNVVSTQRILDYASKKKNKVSILFFSTSEIYGNPDKKNIPTKESYNGNVSCVGPRACYDESKRYAETLCYLYGKKKGVNVKVVRPFNHFGPGLDLRDGRVPCDFAKSIITKKNIKIFSDGKPKRSFCYVVNGIIAYINIIGKNGYDVYNVGDDSKEISILELAKKYQKISKKLFNYKPKIILQKNKDKEYLSDVPLRRFPDLSKIKTAINYKVRVKIDEGITKYILFNNIYEK